MTVVRCTPATVDQFSHETLSWRFNFTNLLSGAETVASATATLIDLTTGLSYTAGLTGSPTVATPYVTLVVTALLAKRRYRLSAIGTVTASKIWEMAILVEVPY